MFYVLYPFATESLTFPRKQEILSSLTKCQEVHRDVLIITLQACFILPFFKSDSDW
jgi:hypothetical protein